MARSCRQELDTPTVRCRNYLATWLKVPGADEAAATVRTQFISEQRKPLHRSTVISCSRPRAPPLPCPSQLTPTCCVTPAVSLWPTREPVRGSFRTTSATGRSSILSSTPPPTRRSHLPPPRLRRQRHFDEVVTSNSGRIDAGRYRFTVFPHHRPDIGAKHHQRQLPGPSNFADSGCSGPT